MANKTMYKTKSGMIGNIINITDAGEWARIKVHGEENMFVDCPLSDLEEVIVEI